MGLPVETPFIPRSTMGGLRSAWRIEGDRLNRDGRRRLSLRNDILNAWLLTIGLFAVLVAWFGIAVLPWLIGQAIIGFSLLETVNYLEHYGLRRRKLPDGRYERVRATDSWSPYVSRQSDNTWLCERVRLCPRAWAMAA